MTDTCTIIPIDTPAKAEPICVTCPTCDMVGHSTRCVCGGTGRITIDLNKLDGFEIWPVVLFTADHQPVPYGDLRGAYFAVDAEEKPHVCGLYGHLVAGHCEHIADFTTTEAARDFVELLLSLADMTPQATGHPRDLLA